MVRKQFVVAFVLTFSLVGVLVGGAQVARADDGHGVDCVVDVVVETRNSTGTVVLAERYSKEFSLVDGSFFFDDFSTRTRFKFFNASLVRSNGDSTIEIDWYADVTVFNSVDIATSVILADGQKQGRSAGEHTLYTSTNSTTTRYSLSCVEK